MNDFRTISLMFCLVVSTLSQATAQHKGGHTDENETNHAEVIHVADEHAHEEAGHGHHAFRRHKLAVFTGNTWVRKGSHEGSSGVVLVPTFGLDYEYWINHKFAIGLHNDIERGRYLVEKNHEEEVLRENAFVSALVAIVEPIHGWAIYAGSGIELEKHEHMWVVRIGTEYAWDLPKDWVIALTVAWDIKKHYDSFASGIVIGKRLGKSH